eukprot:c13425_g1_i1.p1 GENE.c13425_g1_i1~~c13425_g1_i1.p1  ORF type:complete len:315 (-),score=66.99 c13425_g1_i1:160-1104(-)
MQQAEPSVDLELYQKANEVSAAGVTKTYLKVEGNSGEADEKAFLLRNLFVPEECHHYISFAQRIGLASVQDSGYRIDVRNNDRICVKSPELAAILYERVKHFLTPIEVTEEKNFSNGIHYVFGMEGVWEPVGLNDLFRVCRYKPGGHFAPHFDGNLVHSPDHQSFKTLMLYLNDGFEGGSTNFIHEDQQLHQVKIPPRSAGLAEDTRFEARPESVYLRVKPEQGMAIVFNHRILHEGEVLKGSNNSVQEVEKWIMRTEVMYVRSKSSQPVRSEAEERGLRLFYEAQTFEAHGKLQEAVEKYRVAFKLCPKLEFA